MKNKLIIILLLTYPFFAFSQKVCFSEIRLNNGFVAPLRLGMEGLAKGPSYGTELNFYYDFGKTNFYDYKYNSPYTGFGISWQNLGNPEVLGQSFAVFSFMEFKLLKLNKINVNTRINGGLTYLTKKYDKEFNPEHIAIGTNVCFYFNLNFGLHYKFSTTPLSMRLNAGIIHFSNGSVKKPNLGLNQVNVSLAFAWQLNEMDREELLNAGNKEADKKHEFTIMGTLTSSDEYTIQPDGRGGGFLCSTGAIGYNYIYSKIGKIGISADVFYNENLYYYFDTNWDVLIRYYDDPKDIIRAGISIGHELIYKRISFLSYVGLYYYNKVKPNDFLYTRFGLRYYLFKNVFINTTIKAFGFKAHYIESGIGFSFKP